MNETRVSAKQFSLKNTTKEKEKKERSTKMEAFRRESIRVLKQ
jgi:hypothetical protein